MLKFVILYNVNKMFCVVNHQILKKKFEGASISLIKGP